MERERLRKSLLVVLLLGTLLAALIGTQSLREYASAADQAQCASVYMYPLYARIRSFDRSHTKFAAKYSLYLYREGDKDPVPEREGDGFDVLDGVPVLFIPGNAGSYRQVRSIAAEAANIYFDERDTINNEQTRNLDFFAADFNEDFTAFHGRTMLDQAEFANEAVKFILLLYSNRDNPPESVILIGHSMGGVVARVMLALPSYQPKSVNTILTLSLPHLAAPLTFDSDIAKIYLTADRYWFDSFHAAENPLKDVSLISITGGILDTVLPADYTTLGFLVPPTNGFTVFTSGIPRVWTSLDHLAVVWCGQLRRAVAMALLEVVGDSPSQTRSLKERLGVFKQLFLGKCTTEEVHLKVDRKRVGDAIAVMPVNGAILVLSGTPPTVYLCSRTGTASEEVILGDSEDTDLYYCEVVCAMPVPGDVDSATESAFGGDKEPFYAARVKTNHEFVIYEEQNGLHVLTSSLDVTVTMPQLLRHRTLSLDVPLAANIHLPGSSLLMYKMRVEDTRGDFQTFIRQWRTDPYESKFHLNPKTVYVSMHGVAPYTPFHKNTDNGFNLELWTGSKEPVRVSVSIDWINSTRLLMLRYRLALVAFCFAVTFVVAMFQFERFYASGTFPSYLYGLNRLTLPKTLIPICIILCIATPLTKLQSVQWLLNLIDPVYLQDRDEINYSPDSDFVLHSFYLGLNELYLAPLGVVFFLMAVGVNFGVYNVICLLAKLASVVKVPKPRRQITGMAVVSALVLLYLPYQFAYIIAVLIQAMHTARGDDFNFHALLLMMMLWVLPINVPVVIVFVHNLNINWATPFSSHHNFMAVAPILAFAFNAEKPRVFPRLTLFVMGYLVFYALVYGVRHTFWLHHLFNVFCSLLLIGLL